MRKIRKRKWTKKSCKQDALKYNTKSDWLKNSCGAYSAARKNGWSGHCFSHMKKTKYLATKWTKDSCKKDALMYKTRNDWNKKSTSAYQVALKNRWMNELCKHMPIRQKKWSKKLCKKDAQKFRTKNEWFKKSRAAFKYAKKYGWLDEIFSHFRNVNKKEKKEKYNYETNLAKKNALKYKTRYQWQKRSQKMYRIAKKYKILDECCKHMPKSSSIKWSKFEDCYKDALRYKTRANWQKNSCSYHSANKHGWLERCCKHMPKHAISEQEELTVAHPDFMRCFNQKNKNKHLKFIKIKSRKDAQEYLVNLENRDKPDFLIVDLKSFDFCFIEIKTDAAQSRYHKNQIMRYSKTGKKHGIRFKGVFLLSPNGKFDSSISFKDFLIKQILSIFSE